MFSIILAACFLLKRERSFKLYAPKIIFQPNELQLLQCVCFQELQDVPFHYVTDELSQVIRCSSPPAKVLR